MLQRKVTDVVVKEEKMTADTINGKVMILDIKATLGDETKVNIPHLTPSFSLESK